MAEACEYIKAHLAISVESLGKDSLLNSAKTSMSSKLLHSNEDFFADICVRAVQRTKQVNKKGEVKYPINNINVLRSTGKGAKETQYIEGYALNCTVASQGMPKKINKAKIAFLDFNVSKTKLPLGVSIEIVDPEELLKVHEREAEILKERVMMIVKSGANVILTTKAIDDLAIGYLVDHGVMGVRRCKKSDLKKIAKATGGKLILSLANLEGEESFDSSYLGDAEVVSQERIADNELIIIKGTKETNSASIVLRGANNLMLDEMDRSLHDALCAVRRVLESGYIVPGGGAVEVGLAMYLESFARTLGSREQLAIAEFAQALLVIPKTLAVNAAKDASELVAKLCTLHKASQEDPDKKKFARFGLDLIEGKLRDNVDAGVLEPSFSKIKSIQLATEAAMSILRIDDMIKLEKRVEPEGHHHDIDH